MWVSVIKYKRLQREQRFVYTEAEEPILVCLQQEQVYAFSERCPHQQFSLERGLLDPETATIQCPLHQWRFDLHTGQGLNQNSCLKIYPTRIEDGRVWLNTQI